MSQIMADFLSISLNAAYLGFEENMKRVIHPLPVWTDKKGEWVLLPIRVRFTPPSGTH